MNNIKNFDVGIVGLWYGLNYGSILTYYGLNRYIESLNKTTLMIECPLSPTHFENEEQYHSRKFSKNHYNISAFKYISQLKDFNSQCNSFVLGSDQVFNPEICTRFKNTFFLSFAETNKKRIAYAASFGHNDFKFTKLRKLKYNHFLKQFDGISVRESSGLTILKEQLNYEKAVHVVDPIFFQLKNKFKELIKEVEPIKEKNYTLNYILDPTDEKKVLIKSVAKQLDKKFINLLDGFTNKYDENYKLMDLENTLPPIMVQEVLAYYQNADFIITDSFHGTCLAIIFEKPFISIVNKRRGITRFESLLSKLNFMDRLVYDVESAIENKELLKEIDYKKVYEILEKDIEFSRNWLKQKLEETKKEKKKNFSTKLLDKFFDYDFLILKYLKCIKPSLLIKITKGKRQEHYKEKLNKLKEEIKLCKSDKNRYKGN